MKICGKQLTSIHYLIMCTLTLFAIVVVCVSLWQTLLPRRMTTANAQSTIMSESPTYSVIISDSSKLPAMIAITTMPVITTVTIEPVSTSTTTSSTSRMSKAKPTQTTTTIASTSYFISTTLSPDSIIRIVGDAQTFWGDWGDEDICPNKGRVIGYRLQVEDPIDGDGDDTALNSIDLVCNHAQANSFIGSSKGRFGDWKQFQYCPNNTFMIGFKLRSHIKQGDGDDTAANDLQMLCNDGTLLTNSSGTAWGLWGNLIKCPTGGYICGLKTRVETHRGKGDDTALNNVEFTCCY